MINHFAEPKRNQKQQVIQAVPITQTPSSKSSYVHSHHLNLQPSTTHLVLPMPMTSSDYEVAELTWENGQLAMHGLSGLLQCGPTKPTWTGSRTSETLESIVHQATAKQKHHRRQEVLMPARVGSTVASSDGKREETSSADYQAQMGSLVMKRARSESNICGSSRGCDPLEGSACASASATATATFCRESDATLMTYAPLDSNPSFKLKTTDEDSASRSQAGSENQDDDQETKNETGRSHSTRRSRAAAVHNQSERRRRDRINQKMKALQKLVPNASKTDKASMLDEVIEYLKQLQAQVHVMSASRNMMMQQHQHLHQMSLLARMGMGLGMGMGVGMVDINSMPSQSLPPPSLPPATSPMAAPPFVPPPPFMVQDHPITHGSVSLPDPYSFLAQSMNMELYNKMAALYRQQMNQTTQPTTCPPPLHSNNVRGD